MDRNFNIPDEYKDSFQRLVPYINVSLRNDQKVLEALMLYLKLGGEKLARIALDAFKQNQLLQHAETQKQLREAAMLIEQVENAEDEKEEKNTDNDDDDTNDTDY